MLVKPLFLMEHAPGTIRPGEMIRAMAVGQLLLLLRELRAPLDLQNENTSKNHKHAQESGLCYAYTNRKKTDSFCQSFLSLHLNVTAKILLIYLLAPLNTKTISAECVIKVGQQVLKMSWL